jgi:hypothetical protein
VAGAGDVNGDGRDDVIIGAPAADNNVRTSSGSSYVVYGSQSPATLDLNALGAAQGFRLDGAAASDVSGSSVAGAGDVNGDGRDDVIVAAPRNGSGSSYVVYGSQSPGTVDLNALGAAQGFRIDGAAAGDQSGTAVAGAGDVNGDGRGDVILGAYFAGNNGRFHSGSSYVVYSTFLPEITYDDPAVAKVGEATSISPLRFRATGTRSVSVSPPLPAGLSIDPVTGVISGTPTTPGITTHRITLTDDNGSTGATLQIGVVDPQGPAGPQGPGGANGGQGPAGPDGAGGAQGRVGPDGQPGATGAQGAGGKTGKPGATGARGPQGPPGRDAKVTCVSGRIKGHNVTVSCTLRFAKVKGLRSARATLSRGSTVYARGSRGGQGPVRLRATRRVEAGTYTLRLSLTTRSGMTVTRVAVRVR